jgi:hypothetical protein
MQFILILHNVVDGLEFVGPFPDHEAAIVYADRVHGHHNWVTAPLDEPTRLGKEKHGPTS